MNTQSLKSILASLGFLIISVYAKGKSAAKIGGKSHESLNDKIEELEI